MAHEGPALPSLDMAVLILLINEQFLIETN
jgi:hypothetical protein